MVRRVVIPAVVALWGAAIVIGHFASKQTHASGAYASGRSAAVYFGGVMAILGTMYVVRALRDRG
jgi:uncharacterized membrane protein